MCVRVCGASVPACTPRALHVVYLSCAASLRVRVCVCSCLLAVWDTTSTPFITAGSHGSTVNIPSMFFSWKGHSLDFKIPLLRSERALNDEGLRLLRLLGLNDHKFLRSDCGAEQV